MRDYIYSKMGSSIFRQQRNQQRKKLLASYSTSSTLKINMKRLLPPPPLGKCVLHVRAVQFGSLILTSIPFAAQARLFTSKDITANTRRKYRKLPEIRQKKIAEKEEKIRKNHRKLANIFNKVSLHLEYSAYGIELIGWCIFFLLFLLESATTRSHWKNGSIEQHDHYVLKSNTDFVEFRISLSFIQIYFVIYV